MWAHWPSATTEESALGHGQAPLLGLEKPGIHARDDGSASKLPAQTQERSQATGKEVSLADRPEGPIDGLPADCPISTAAGAFSRMFDHTSPSPGTAR